MRDLDIKYVAPELLESTKRAMGENYFSQRVLNIVSYKDAVISPGEGIFDGDGKYINGTSVHDGWPWEGRKEPERKISSNCDVIYLGTFNPCWGHCLTDCLQRLWFVCSPCVSQKIRSLDCVYSVSPPDAQLPQNFYEILSILGFNLKRLNRVNEPIRFNNVYLPDSCFYLDRKKKLRQFTEEYRTMIEMIVDRICPRGHTAERSIYFSRVGWKTNKEIGERRIEEEFKRIGYEIVHPEKMTLQDTVGLLRTCKKYASTDGSIAHNIIFLDKDVEVTIIRKANYINEYQDCINSVAAVDVRYIDANCSNMLYDSRSPWYGPFFLYVNKRLADFTKGKPHFPIVDYLRYCVLSLWRQFRTWLSKTCIGDLKRTFLRAIR